MVARVMKGRFVICAYAQRISYMASVNFLVARLCGVSNAMASVKAAEFVFCSCESLAAAGRKLALSYAIE